MSRRTSLLLGLIGLGIALLVGMYGPRCLDVEDPVYAANVLSFLNPCGEHASDAATKSDQPALIEVKIFVVMLPSLSTDHPRLASRGIVADAFGLLDAIQKDRDSHAMVTPRPRIFSGQSFFLPPLCGRPKLADDGVTMVPVECGIKARGTPILCSDGKIHLEFEIWILNTFFEPVHAKGSFHVQDGQTCYIGGMIRNMPISRSFEIPLLSQLPAFGDSFRWYRETRRDMPVLFLATPKVVAVR
jgi:hypothetical protein